MQTKDQIKTKSDSFAYPTIEEYEELVGFKVNDAFRSGWMMARTMNSHINALTNPPNREMIRRSL